MANTFKVSTRDVAPASAGTFEEIYDCPDNTTAVIIGLSLANVHTAQVTASVKLVSNLLVLSLANPISFSSVSTSCAINPT